MLIIQLGQTNCDIFTWWNTTQQQKGADNWHIEQHKRTSKYLSWVKEANGYTKWEEPQSPNSVIMTGSRSAVTWRTCRSAGGTVRAHWPQRGAPLLGVTGMLVTLVVTLCVCQNSVVQFNYVQSINYQFHLSKIAFKVKKKHTTVHTTWINIFLRK